MDFGALLSLTHCKVTKMQSFSDVAIKIYFIDYFLTFIAGFIWIKNVLSHSVNYENTTLTEANILNDMTSVNLEKSVKYLKTTESLEGRGGENAGWSKSLKTVGQ